MGSGCNSNCPTYFKQTTPDSEIIYTGPAIPSLGICTGDKLSEIESVVLQKLVDYSTGVGINIPDIDLTSCDLFVDFITCCSSCTDLNCLMKVIFTSLCTLYNDFSGLETKVNNLLNGPYDTSCLPGVGTNSTLNQIIQAMIKQICSLALSVSDLETKFNTFTSGLPTTIGNFLDNALSSCQGTSGTGGMTKTGSGATFAAAFKGFNLIGAIIPYAGPTAGLFDTTGLGLPNTPACGWAFANGNNGTQNMVEQIPIGVGIGAMGGTVPSNASGANYTLFSKVGEAFHTLSISEIPSFSVGGTIPSIIGSVDLGDQIGFVTSVSGNNGISYPFGIYGGPAAPHNRVTANFTTPVTPFSATGGGSGAKHNNVQPSTALLFIQRIN